MKHFLIADHHSITRLGIRVVISENFASSFIQEAQKVNEVEVAIKERHFDIIILNIDLPDTDFLSLLRWLSTVMPAAGMLVLSHYPEQLYGMKCLDAGASGYINTRASNAEILAAIQRVLEKKKYISPELAEVMMKIGYDGMLNPFNRLSARELEITRLLHKGHKLPAICKLLNIQYSTGNTYKKRIFEKLDIKNIIALERLLQSFNFPE